LYAPKHALHPRGLFIRTNENKVAHKQTTPIYPRANACAYRDTPTSNYASSASTTKPLKTIRLFHRRKQSIQKSQVSNPFHIRDNNDGDVFDVIASGGFRAGARKVPKAAEKAVKIDAPRLVKPSPQPKPTNTPSQSWYTPAPAHPPQLSISNATPRTIPRKVNVTGVNLTKPSTNRGVTKSEGQRDGIELVKRHVLKNSITHPKCPWIEPTNNPIANNGCPPQHLPVRSVVKGTRRSNKMAIKDEAPTRTAINKATPLVKPINRVSKPLPELPPPDPITSRWSMSTDSVYSDNGSFSYDLFPRPPRDMPNLVCFKDWENSNSLLVPTVLMPQPNASSSSVATITPTAVPNFSVKPLTLKKASKPKVATVVHQTPRASYSCTQLQHPAVTWNDRAYPCGSMNHSIHPFIQTTGAAPSQREPERSEMDSGYNPPYKGEKVGRRVVDPNGFELIKPEMGGQRKWL